jgi:glyoxylate reductase
MKILVTGNIPPEVISTLEKDHEVAVHQENRPMERSDLLKAVADKDGILSMINDQVDRGLFDQAPNIKIVSNCAVGYDNIDMAEATQRNILVTNTPDVTTNASADVTLALMLSVARRIVEGDKRTRSGGYKHFLPFDFLGTEVTGKTLGIVGLGKIGKAVARRAIGFDMRVLYFKRSRIEVAEEAALGIEYASFEDLLKEADFISLHVPLNKASRHLISTTELEMMKSSAYLINTARGPIVNETALVEALQVGRIAGAGLDVYENEPELAPGLAQLENVVLLPHVGSATLETRTSMAVRAANNLLTGLKGDRPPDCLNWEKISN